MSKLYVIGVDVGNGDTKTVHSSHRSSVREISGDSLSDSVLKLDDKTYVVGENIPSYNAMKFTDINMKINVLAGIASEVKERGILDTEIDVWLGVGVPIAHWARQKEKIKDYFMATPDVKFEFRNNTYIVHIHGCNVMPQGFAALSRYGLEGQGNLFALDIGNGTLDFLHFHNGKLIERESGSEEFGVSKCYELVKNAIMSNHAFNISYDTFENYIKGTTTGIKEELFAVIDEALCEYCSKVMDVANRVGFDARIGSLHIMGGGANILKKYGNFKDFKVTFDTNIHGNSIGFEYCSKQYLSKLGVEYYE